MRAAFTRSVDVRKSPRVMQVAGLMDVPVEERSSASWDIELPIEGRPWQVGLIVGPSGSGKSSLARELWPDVTAPAESEWPADDAVLDAFPDDMGVREVTALLTSVGLGSVPAWLRPYRTLSTGEAFRADIARVLARGGDLAVVDEFTSVVDRQVAKITSHSVQKAVRRSERRFVAVTCHYDVVDWLQPDWVLDMAGGAFTWRCLQRHPRIEFRVYPVDRAAWRVFRRHHYLSGSLHKAARCFGGFVGDECVAFTSYLHFAHPRAKNIKMAHRTVVLPDWQGLGLSGRLVDWMGQHLYEQGWRLHRSIAHPAVIAHCARSPRWRAVNAPPKALKSTSTNPSLRARSTNLRLFSQRSFEYVPPLSPASTSTASATS